MVKFKQHLMLPKGFLGLIKRKFPNAFLKHREKFNAVVIFDNADWLEFGCYLINNPQLNVNFSMRYRNINQVTVTFTSIHRIIK